MTRRTFWQAALAAALLTAGSAPSFAQGGGGGGGRGGFGGGFGFGGPGGPGGPSSMGLLRIPEVQKELKLEQAQIELIQGMQQAGRGQRPNFQEFQSLSPEERQKRMQAFFADMQKQRAEQDKQVEQILDAKQMARLKQLKLQQAGIRALGQKEVQDSLKLTPDQRQKVADTTKAEQDGMRQMFESFRPGADQQQPSDEQRQQGFQKMQALRTGTDAKLNGILTASQKTQFETMKGAAFTFPQRRFPGGPGGRQPGT